MRVKSNELKETKLNKIDACVFLMQNKEEKVNLEKNSSQLWRGGVERTSARTAFT